LLKAERRECGKTLELSRSIDADYARRAEKQTRAAVQRPAVAVPVSVPGQVVSLAQVYDAHRADILTRQKGEIDYSRLDSMIALRMRATEYDRGAIQAAIRDGAPRSRPDDAREGHQWDDYAKRTANSAYTPRADRQLESLAPKYAEQWARLEGRELPSIVAARTIAVDLTAEQFRLVAEAENVLDAMYKATVEDKEITILGGRGKIGYDQESKKLYARLKKEDQPELERQLTRLTQKQKEIEHEIGGYER
jgi:hypothetical protein